MTAMTAGIDRISFLRRALWGDAATCIAAGTFLWLGAAPLARLFGLPEALLFWAGLALLPCAAVMLLVASRRMPLRLGAWIVILGNALWVAGSLLVLALFSATALGLAFVIGQAVLVALLAELEYYGLRQVAP